MADIGSVEKMIESLERAKNIIPDYAFKQNCDETIAKLKEAKDEAVVLLIDPRIIKCSPKLKNH
jgi:hypothetical protein